MDLTEGLIHLRKWYSLLFTESIISRNLDLAFFYHNLLAIESAFAWFVALGAKVKPGGQLKSIAFGRRRTQKQLSISERTHPQKRSRSAERDALVFWHATPRREMKSERRAKMISLSAAGMSENSRLLPTTRAKKREMASDYFVTGSLGCCCFALAWARILHRRRRTWRARNAFYNY